MKLVKIRMLEDASGHDIDDRGVTQPVKHFAKGSSHEVHEDLAKCFFQEKKAEHHKGEKVKEDSGHDEELDRKSNKSMKGAPENK